MAEAVENGEDLRILRMPSSSPPNGEKRNSTLRMRAPAYSEARSTLRRLIAVVEEPTPSAGVGGVAYAFSANTWRTMAFLSTLPIAVVGSAGIETTMSGRAWVATPRSSR